MNIRKYTSWRVILRHILHAAAIEACLSIAFDPAIYRGLVVKTLSLVLHSPCTAFDRSDPVEARALLKARLARIRAVKHGHQ